MKVKHLAILVAVLGGASALTLLFKRDDDAPKIDPREGQPLVDAAVVRNISGLRIHATAGDVELTKSGTAGGKWVVKSYHDLPADFSKIRTLIDDLEKARITSFASANADRIAKMGFEGTTLELRGADGKPVRTLHIGKNATSGGRFVKLDDETKAYVASFSTFLDTTAKNWADAALISAKPEDVLALEVSFPEGAPLRLKRDNGSAPWTAEGLAEGEKVKDSEVSSLLSKFTGLRFSETADPTTEEVTAARANARTFKVTLATGKSYDVALGRKPAPPAPPPEEKPATTDAAASAPADGEEKPATEPTESTPPPAAPTPPPPGPVYVFVTSSDPNDAINASMQRRGFQIYEWTYTSLPANRAALIEAAPAPTPPAAPEATPPPAAPAEPTPPAPATPQTNP